MKHLPKHLRERWRYLAVELEAWPAASFGQRAFQCALWQSAQRLLGDAGSADAVCRVLQYRFEAGVGEAIVKVRRGTVESARAAVACVSEVEGEPVGLSVRGVSGTVRGCEEKYMGGPLKAEAETDVEFRGASQTGVVYGDRVDVETDDWFTGATTFDIG